MTVTVLRGDARRLPLPDACVDLVVTSPPYFGLRSYTDGGEHYDGQIGSEATPQEYVAALIECTREWARVLKPAGSMFVNLGDKYAGSDGTKGGTGASTLGGGRANGRPRDYGSTTFDGGGRRVSGTPKSLIGLPWRYALACMDQLGLILRAEIIWSKPNGLPESVTDRVRRAHEQVFHFTLRPRYYSAVDEIREPHADWTLKAYAYEQAARARNGTGYNRRVNANRNDEGDAGDYAVANPLGKLPGSVWDIPSQPLTVPPALGVDHFAAYPFALVRPIILGWSPRAVCDDCGFLLGSSYDYGMLGVRNRVHPSHQATQHPALLQQDLQHQGDRTQPGINHVPPVDDARLRRGLEAGPSDGAEERLPDGTPARDGGIPRADAGAARGSASPEQHQDRQPDRKSGAARQDRARQAAQAAAQAIRVPALRRSHPHRRDAEHACPHCGSDQLRPSVVVDGFGGTGTTALVASVLGRHGISVDRSADYCRLAAWRTTDPGERARAMEVPKPPPVADGQEALFAFP